MNNQNDPWFALRWDITKWREKLAIEKKIEHLEDQKEQLKKENEQRILCEKIGLELQEEFRKIQKTVYDISDRVKYKSCPEMKKTIDKYLPDFPGEFICDYSVRLIWKP